MQVYVNLDTYEVYTFDAVIKQIHEDCEMDIMDSYLSQFTPGEIINGLFPHDHADLFVEQDWEDFLNENIGEMLSRYYVLCEVNGWEE